MAFERVPSDGGSEGSAFSRAASLRGAVGKVMMANAFVRVASKGSAGKELLTLDDDSGPCKPVFMCVSADQGGLRVFSRSVIRTNTANRLHVWRRMPVKCTGGYDLGNAFRTDAGSEKGGDKPKTVQFEKEEVQAQSPVVQKPRCAKAHGYYNSYSCV